MRTLSVVLALVVAIGVLPGCKSEKAPTTADPAETNVTAPESTTEVSKKAEPGSSEPAKKDEKKDDDGW